MKYLKGTSGNENGRPVGSKNKITKEVRTAFKLFLEDNLERLQEDFDQLTPAERIRFSIEMAKFVIPTLKATEVSNIGTDNFTPVQIILDNDRNKNI